MSSEQMNDVDYDKFCDAIKDDDMDTVLWFINVDPSIIMYRWSNYHSPPIDLAIENGRFGIVYLLLERADRTDERYVSFINQALFPVVMCERLDLVKLLVEKYGADVNTIRVGLRLSIHNIYPLTFAISMGYNEIVVYLIESGAYVGDVSCNIGETVFEGTTTALIKAIEVLNNEAINVVLRAFIEEGLDVNEPDEDGRKPLEMAVYYNEYDTIRLLLEAGADLVVPI